MESPFLFLHVHLLAHKFSACSIFSEDERIEFVHRILHIMNTHRVLHPAYPQILSFLQQSSGSRDNAAQLLERYGPDWAASIRDGEIASQLEDAESMGEDADKEHLFATFLPKFYLLFIQANFTDLLRHVNRLSLAAEFRIHCTDHEQFIGNRYFELIFYQLVAIIYGQLWFSESSVLEEAPNSGSGSSNVKSWQQLENNAKNYHFKSQFLLKSLKDKRQELVDGVNAELDYYYLVKWLCALGKFNENRLNDFEEDFCLLQDQMAALDTLGLKVETVLMYQVATVATKNFCNLVSRESESLMELYSGTLPVETQMLCFLCKLLEADFAGAKTVYNSGLTQLMDAFIGYAIPQKLKGTFWQYLNVIVDLKVFLLIISCALLMSRTKLLELMGYGSADNDMKENVSAGVLTLIAALSLGKVNVTYDPTKHTFSRKPLTETQKMNLLTEQLDELDHSIATDAAAQLVKTSLVEKLFSTP